MYYYPDLISFLFSYSVVNTGLNFPAPFANAEPILKDEKSHDWKVHKKPKGPGIYVVVKCGASGHNIRSNPNLLAPPIGMLALGDVVTVLRTKEVNGEVWIQLDLDSSEKHCFATGNELYDLLLSRSKKSRQIKLIIKIREINFHFLQFFFQMMVMLGHLLTLIRIFFIWKPPLPRLTN